MDLYSKKFGRGVLQNRSQICHIPSINQPADLLTKVHASSRFTWLWSKLNVKEFASSKLMPQIRHRTEANGLDSSSIILRSRAGPRELTGALDLLSHFKLLPHFDFFCKRPLPISILDAQYLCNVVGDTEIRKGDGMQLDQLIHNTYLSRDTIQPLDLDTLKEAFQLKETAPLDLPITEKGIPTIAGKSKSESKDKDKRHKKHKDKDNDKDKEYKKHKHHHKDRSKDREKDKKKDISGPQDSSVVPSKKHHKKKRKHDGDDDLNNLRKHKISKHRGSKIDELGAIKVAG